MEDNLDSLLEGAFLIRIIVLLTILLIAFSSKAYERLPIVVYAYHLKPPFIIDVDKKLGLYYDFSDHLNSKQDRYLFTTKFMPRKRLDFLVRSNKLNGILVGVNPIWFNDKKEQKFLWTGTMFNDRDEVVSPIDKPIEFINPRSLIGKTLAGVRGFNYFGIDNLVDDGKINRDNTIGERQILLKLLSKRVDAGIVSRSTLNYLIPRQQWENKFYYSQIPHDIYQRRVLVPKALNSVHQQLMPIIKTLPTDADWQRLLKQYN